MLRQFWLRILELAPLYLSTLGLGLILFIIILAGTNQSPLFVIAIVFCLLLGWLFFSVWNNSDEDDELSPSNKMHIALDTNSYLKIAPVVLLYCIKFILTPQISRFLLLHSKTIIENLKIILQNLKH